MAKRLNASTPVERDGKTYWTRCGVAFVGDKGIQILLDAVPVNGKLFLSEPLPPRDGQQGSYGGGDSNKSMKDAMDDEMPF